MHLPTTTGTYGTNVENVNAVRECLSWEDVNASLVAGLQAPNLCNSPTSPVKLRIRKAVYQIRLPLLRFLSLLGSVLLVSFSGGFVNLLDSAPAV